jgi:hypothetical protein
METILYVCTAALTVAWSVFTYISWTGQERRGEYVVGRFFLVVGPSAYLLLLILTGWSRVPELRLDLVGIMLLDVLTAACWLGLLLARALKARDTEPKRVMAGFLIAYHVLAALLVLGVFLVRTFPPLRIPIASWIQQGMRLEFLRLAWAGLNPEARQQDVASLANKVLIALLSYIPVSLVRSILVNRQISRQRREMYRQIEELKRRVEELERRGLPRRSAAEPISSPAARPTAGAAAGATPPAAARPAERG